AADREAPGVELHAVVADLPQHLVVRHARQVDVGDGVAADLVAARGEGVQLRERELARGADRAGVDVERSRQAVHREDRSAERLAGAAVVEGEAHGGEGAGLDGRLRIGVARLAGVTRVTRVTRVAGVARLTGVTRVTRVAGVARLTGIARAARVARVARVRRVRGVRRPARRARVARAGGRSRRRIRLIVRGVLL